MKDKEKQIEEMAKIVCNACRNNEHCYCKKQPCEVAEKEVNALYEQGYRKIDKDSVVLSREKRILANKVYSFNTLMGWKKEDLIDHIRILEYNWSAAEKTLDNQAKNYKMLLDQARKETAEKILKFVAEHSDNECIVWLLEDFIAKQLSI